MPLKKGTFLKNVRAEGYLVWEILRWCLNENNSMFLYHSMQVRISLPFHWPRAHHVTYKLLPTNNGPLMHKVVHLLLAANNILLLC